MADTRYIVAGSFIDGTGSGAMRNIFLAVEGGVITTIGSAKDLSHINHPATDDFSHCTIVPALVDCSVSLIRSPAIHSELNPSGVLQETSKKSDLLERHIRYCHAHGVLGIAENFDFSGLSETCHEYIKRQNMVTLRLPGHDYFRIQYSGDIDHRNSSIKQPDYDKLCRTLKCKEEKKAVVVANGPRQVAEAIRAGCDAIEQGYGMGEDNLRKMADKNILWIPNAVRAKNALDSSGSGGDVCCRFSTRYAAPGKGAPGAEAFWKKMLADHLDQLRLARKLGVKSATGTGAGTIGILHGESVVEEIKLFMKAGYSLAESIACASGNGAVFFGMNNLGALTVGNNATFLITRGTPQQLPRKLGYLEGIYMDGSPSPKYTKNHGNS